MWAGLGIQYAAKSEISKTFLPLILSVCPCLEEVVVKEINTVLLIRSWSDVKNYLLSMLLAT